MESWLQKMENQKLKMSQDNRESSLIIFHVVRKVRRFCIILHQ